MKARRGFRSRMLTPGAMVVIAVAVLATFAFGAAVPNPTLSGPIPVTAIPGSPSHNYTFFSTNHDLATHGYVEEEYFFAGTANQYTTPTPSVGQPCPTCTGTVISSGHPYMTRLVVRRPANREKFNGTVLVEWYNVTNGFDAENTWFFSWESILRSGSIWVGVSAQRVGVNALKTWSPSRYGTLDVTQGGTINDDSLSYDIFSQAGQAILHPSGIDVPERHEATGHPGDRRVAVSLSARLLRELHSATGQPVRGHPAAVIAGKPNPHGSECAGMESLDRVRCGQQRGPCPST